MKTRLLGNTGIEISEIGYGAAALFGKNVLGKQGITEDTAYSLFTTALENGITFFDTGINYGYAEERLGRCIKKAIEEGIVSRSSLVIESKCGETVLPNGSYGPTNWSPDWIKKSLEISLKRLNLDYLDLFAMHSVCKKRELEPLIKTFEDMKSNGLIRAYGINTFDTDFLEYVAREKIFDYVMLDYNIMKQDREPLIRRLVDSGIGVIAGCALGQSLYSKKIYKIRNKNDLWYMLRTIVKFRELMNRSKDYRFLTKYKNVTANQLALRYVLDNEYISSAVFSTINLDHLTENIRACRITMPEKIRKEIKKRA